MENLTNELILFLIVGSHRAVYSFSKLGWLCKLTWPASSESRGGRGRKTYFWFIDNLMFPSFKVSESTAKGMKSVMTTVMTLYT